MTDTQEQTVRAYLAQHAPGLLDALLWVARDADGINRDYMRGSTRALLEATEAAGLLDKPQPAPLPAMFCGAEAFGEDGA